MSKLQDTIYKSLPHFAQNTLVTLFDFLQYRKRHSGRYRYWTDYFRNARSLPLDALKKEQAQLLEKFLTHAQMHSPYYQGMLQHRNFSGDNLFRSYAKI